MNVLALLNNSHHQNLPKPQVLNPLPPFDLPDSGGNVYTVPPPGWVAPGPNNFTADFNGVTLNLNKWPGLSIPTLLN